MGFVAGDSLGFVSLDLIAQYLKFPGLVNSQLCLGLVVTGRRGPKKSLSLGRRGVRQEEEDGSRRETRDDIIQAE